MLLSLNILTLHPQYSDDVCLYIFVCTFFAVFGMGGPKYFGLLIYLRGDLQSVASMYP